MNISSPKLIIIRGNSGSGKTTIAKKLRDLSSEKIAVISQDVIRREILREKESDDMVNTALIAQMVEFLLSRGYHVILEGILRFSRYGEMLYTLMQTYPNHYAYYLDVSFEETLRRHRTKLNAHEFGEKEMKEWFKEKDLMGLKAEKMITESTSFQDIISLIAAETNI